jgi:hypothetical protein
VHLPLERFDPRLLPPCSEVFEYSSRTPTRRKLYMPPLSSTILRERGWGLILSVEPSPMGK